MVIHKSVSVPGSYAHTAETKKVPKDCHAYTWYPLTLLTILNSVCPGFPPYRLRRNLQLAEIWMFRILSYRIHHSFPPFTDRHRIKINYGIILAQHLVFCQLNNTISSIFSLSIFVRKNPSAKFILLFFKFFQVSAPLSGTSFLDCPVTAVHLYQASVL